jgi:hypothetical protein
MHSRHAALAFTGSWWHGAVDLRTDHPYLGITERIAACADGPAHA